MKIGTIQKGQHISMSLDFEFMQCNAYECGVNALAYLLHILGYNVDIVQLRNELGPTLKAGTAPIDIARALKKRKIRFIHTEHCLVKDIKPPCLVIYQYLNDGHYGVILSKTETHISIFEPWQAKIHRYTIKHFKKQWYSKRYEKQWCLIII